MQTQSPILKWSVILGIIIVLNLFFNYALSLVYERPNYEDFCTPRQVVTMPENQEACLALGGQWTDTSYIDRPIPTSEPKGYCDLDFTCRQEFSDAQSGYDRNVFIVLVFLGALVVALGNFFKGNLVISIGLSLAGVLSFIIASMRYWSAANDLFRVIILAIALAILFWVAYKKFNDRVQS